MAFENVDYDWFLDLPTIEDQIIAVEETFAKCAWELSAGHMRVVRQWIKDMDLNVQAHVYQNAGSRVRSLVLVAWEHAYEAQHGIDAFDELADTLTRKWGEMIGNGATVEDASAAYAAALLSGIRS